MKKLLAVALTALLLGAAALVIGLQAAPQATQAAWTALGLPPAPLEQASRLLSAEPPSTPPPAGIVLAAGTVEAEEVTVAAETAGRVVAVLVSEGEAVTAGQPLVQLDDSLLRARLVEADRAVEMARANLAVVQAEPQPAHVAAARAQVSQAQAALAGAQQALADAQAALESPLALEAQINSAAARVALLRRQVEQARAQQAAAAVLRQAAARDSSDQGKTQAAMYEKQEAAAAQQVAAAQAELQGAQRALAYLRRMREAPLALEVQVRAAEQAVAVAEAALAVAQAELALVEAGPRPEAVAVAEAQVAEAEAARGVLEAQLAQTVLYSPLDGVVTQVAVRSGEMAAPASPLLKVSRLDRVTVTAYVPEAEIGRVRVGQPARVRVDAHPGRAFLGAVTYISPRAQFTPRSVQTAEERAKTVFAVRITLSNPDQALKPGMPADVEIGP
ncbi:MAG: efflux RND transporter periplasmic adaptor subunit [Caldilineales bacterium]|nr:efflux RND transporter periplasmic adaptor subunit [Caldilineales bacterium]MDW8317761.1 efflux RND transporter periplasmic adaptor subunit [Anaerolineae bacterium]